VPETRFADNTAQSRFELSIDGRVAGFASYDLDDGAVRITHTEVTPDNEGGGIGSKLAKAALDQVRQRGQQVVPQCEFIASYIQRHQEYADLVAKR
jgi:predicted GNAT family acetyltransferase